MARAGSIGHTRADARAARLRPRLRRARVIASHLHFTGSPLVPAAAALARVESHGFVHDYRGVRIAKSGRRFWIERGTLFNVLSEAGERIGQVAVFRSTAPA